MPAIRDGVFRYNSETGLASWGNEKTYNEWFVIPKKYDAGIGVPNATMAEHQCNDQEFRSIEPIAGVDDPAWELTDKYGIKTILYMNER